MPNASDFLAAVCHVRNVVEVGEIALRRARRAFAGKPRVVHLILGVVGRAIQRDLSPSMAVVAAKPRERAFKPRERAFKPRERAFKPREQACDTLERRFDAHRWLCNTIERPCDALKYPQQSNCAKRAATWIAIYCLLPADGITEACTPIIAFVTGIKFGVRGDSPTLGVFRGGRRPLRPCGPSKLA